MSLRFKFMTLLGWRSDLRSDGGLNELREVGRIFWSER